MNAIELITAKAARNIAKGYTAAHDDTHRDGELCEAALCFLHCADIQREADYELAKSASADDLWPFEPEAYQPSTDPIENLVAAGALIVAEIERLQREKDRVR